MSESHLRPARRFLHVCYCCADTDPATAFFVDGLGMRNVMNTPHERSDGGLLGLDGEVEGAASFVYDPRGPRTSPAIEVQSWVDPPLVGEPHEDPTAVGVHALGFSVPDLGAAVDRLTGLGASVLGSGSSPFGSRWTTLRDDRGVGIDLVDESSVPAGESRLRHLRITCSDLDASVAWYEGLGFRELERAHIDDASFLGMDGPVEAEAARLRLPDEGTEALLIEWETPRSHGRHYTEPNHAGLYRTAVGVDDTRRSYEAMSEAGWTFDRAPRLVELHGTPVPDMWICFLSDPDGVPFEFVERPRSAFRA